MSVFRRKGSPYWRYDFVFEGRRYQSSTKLINKRAAQSAEDILRADLAQSRAGIVERKPAPLFGEFADEFLERVKPELRPRSHLRYRDSLKPLRDRFAAKRLSDITADEIEKFKQSRLEQIALRRHRKPLSPSTVNRDLACLRRILFFAVRTDRLASTPFIARKVRFLKESGRERILNFEEERKYLGAARQPLRDVASLMLELGLRPEEVCAIRKEDVHSSAASPYLHVPGGKTTNAKRDVPLTRQSKGLLVARCGAAKGEYIFPFREGTGFDWSRPMSELHPAHYAALKGSKVLPPFQVYDLRHTYGTRAIEGGTDVLTLMRLMGHADLKTTARYVHLSKRHLDEAQKKIEEYRAVREIAEAEALKSSSVLSNAAVQ
jgi:integrase